MLSHIEETSIAVQFIAKVVNNEYNNRKQFLGFENWKKF